MKIISFEVENPRDLRLLLKLAKLIGVKRVSVMESQSSLTEKVNREIRKAENGFDKDY